MRTTQYVRQERAIRGPEDFTDDCMADLLVIERQIEETTVRAAILQRQRTDGYLYVIEFTTGVIKVGRTVSPDQRLASHRKAAAIHGVDVARSWVSANHDQCSDSEAQLIAFCSNSGTRLGASRVKGEYFRDLAFADVQHYAQRVVMDRRRRAYLGRLIEAAEGDLSMTWEAAQSLLPDDELPA